MEEFQYLNIKDIQANPYQPRTEFSQEKLEELAISIKNNGLIQPLIVRKSSLIGYELLAGERRFRAAKLANLQDVPVIVKELTDLEMMEQSIVENLQREDLNPIEEAISYQHLIDKGLTHEEVAHKMGKSRPYISNCVRLLNLSQKIQLAVKEGTISQAHARLLVPYPEEDQERWLHKIQKEEIAVRQLEKLLKKTKKEKSSKKDPFILKEEENLKKLLGTDVSIQVNKSMEGNIKIYFSNPDEYERIINSLK